MSHSEDLKVPKEKISEFLRRLREAAGANLECVVLYGSALTGEYDPEFSDINLLCILRDASLPALEALAPAVKWWNKQRHPAPLMLGRHELQRSAEVFAIEFTDIKAQHRVLYGDNPIASLEISAQMRQAQLEYEMREKLILLRQELLFVAGDRKRTWDLLRRSLPAFATLCRHVLIAKGENVPSTKRESIQALASSVGFDASALLEVVDAREHGRPPEKTATKGLAARYLAAVEQMVAAVDGVIGSLGSSRPQAL
jgi:predicted nucleotidyltransferase